MYEELENFERNQV
jgi:hypothetical protein